MQVLQINADNFGNGGISQIIWRFMQYLKNEDIIFSYFTYKKNVPLKYSSNVKKLGGNIIQVSLPTGSCVIRIYRKYKQLINVLSENQFDVIHVNSNDMLGALIYVIAGRKKGIKIIVHAHTTKYSSNNKIIIWSREFINIFLRIFLLNRIDIMLACSTEAARYMYGRKKAKDVIIIPNGLEPQEYLFDYEKRKKIRCAYNVSESTKVIGHIGRFTYAKNHEYIVKVFEKMIKSNDEDVELWLIGDGELKENILEKIEEYSIQNRVKLISHTDDIQGFLSAMDILLFPSRYEGFPLVILEAQASNLPIICSDAITKEVIISNKVYQLSLEEDSGKWADKIYYILKQNCCRITADEIEGTGLDIKQIVKKLIRIYHNTVRNESKIIIK